MDSITLEKYKSDANDFYEKNIPQDINFFVNNEKLKKLQNRRLNFLFPIFLFGYFLLQSLDEVLQYLFSNTFFSLALSFILIGVIFFYQTPNGKKTFQNIKNYFTPASRVSNPNIDFEQLEKKFINNYNLFLDPKFKIFETNNIPDKLILQVKDQSNIAYKSSFQILSKKIFETSFGEFCIWSCKTGGDKNGNIFDIILLPKFVKNENIPQFSYSQTTSLSGKPQQQLLPPNVENIFYKPFLKYFGVYDETTFKMFKMFFGIMMGIFVFIFLVLKIENIFPGSISNLGSSVWTGIFLLVIFFFTMIWTIIFLVKSAGKEASMDIEINFLKPENNYQVSTTHEKFLSILGLNPAYNEIINFDNKSFLIINNLGIYDFDIFLSYISLDQAKENVIYRRVEARINYENLKNAMKLV